MKILIMGSGAVGGYFGAVLHGDGHDVLFVARGEHLEAIRQQGLRIESTTSGDFTIRPEATDRPDGRWKADLALYCVKEYDNPTAIEVMRPAVGEGTSILTLQNGIGGGDVLTSAFGREKVLLGVTYVDSSRKEPGVVHEYSTGCNIVFGEEDGQRTRRAVTIHDILRDAGINVELSPNVLRELWNKFIFICGLSGMTCITRAPFPEVLSNPQAVDLTWRVMKEAYAVAGAKGVDLEEGFVEKTMAYFQEIGGRLGSSMHTDLERGSPIEVGVLNGAVARFGAELGIETPVNEFIAVSLSVAHNRAMSKRA